MAKKRRRTFGDELIEALEEIAAFARGEAMARVKTVTLTEPTVTVAPPHYNAERIRAIHLGLDQSQTVFAQTLGMSAALVRVRLGTGRPVPRWRTPTPSPSRRGTPSSADSPHQAR